MKNVLVTGGAGFIGSNLVKRLCDENFNVTVVDDLSSGHLKNLDEVLMSVNLRTCDFADDNIIKMIETGKFDSVLHIAAIPRVLYSVENPVKTTDVNVMKTIRLMEACVGNVRRVVFASSSSVVGDTDVRPTHTRVPKIPKSPYAMQKSVIEDFGRLFGDLYDLDFVSLRFFNVFGPNQYGGSPYSTVVSAWCHAVKNGMPLRSDGDGNQTRDMCYVDNTVDAIVRACKYENIFRGDVFNVACGKSVSNNEILEYFKNRFPNVVVHHAPERLGDVKHTLADIDNTKIVLGYVPIVDFWAGLEKTLKWWEL